MTIDWLQVIPAEAKAAARADRMRIAVRDAALRYLADTDWYVIRASDTGEQVPETVRARRAEARKLLSGNPR